MLNKQLFIAISLSVLVGCAVHEEAANSRENDGQSRAADCISKSSIRDYKVLDESNLIVTEGASRRYHVSLTRRAFGLRSSSAIGFQSNSSHVCGGFDRLIVDEPLGREAIRIAEIRRVTPDEEQRLLVRFGLIEPEYEQPRQPQKVEGAEVEELD